MELIERYLHETGKYLPRKNREDILAEIKSHLEDTLDERTGGKPSDDDVAALLKETGSPQKMAASYSPQGQYVVGPALFPLWRMVTGIAIAATIGAQLLALAISFWGINGYSFDVEMVGDLLISTLTTIGSVTVVFMILQAYGVQPKLDEKWDPHSLPEIKEGDDVKRGELIFGIAGGSILLALLAVMPEIIGVFKFPGGDFFVNPIILQFLPLICLSILINIGLDIYMLWCGRWNLASRVLQMGADLFSIVLLTLLYKGHTEWLIAHGARATANLFEIVNLGGDIWGNFQIFGMESFRLAFAIALVVTVVVTISKLVKMIINSLRAAAQ